jgi:glyoxylase-like metal-dependent hydrolase (beta-lactamase superfamily II)
MSGISGRFQIISGVLMPFSSYIVSAARSVLLSVRLVAAGICASAVPAISFAAAPMIKTQAPGYFRMMLGAFEVTAISDGTLDLPVDTLLSANAKQTRADLVKSYLEVPLETSFNAYLINTGTKLVLIDTGGGLLFGDQLGKLIKNIEEAGYKASQIDDVLLTHLHSDHVGGLIFNGAIAFPNATVHADRRESDYWLSTERMKTASADSMDFFKAAMASLGPYIQAGKYQPFDAGTVIVPGVTANAAYGHTAGSTVYTLESKGRKLLLIGDLIHVGPVQFDKPEVTIQFDADRIAAKATRLMVFSQIAKSGQMMGASHLPFPGLGHLRATSKGYQWMPVDYTTHLK